MRINGRHAELVGCALQQPQLSNVASKMLDVVLTVVVVVVDGGGGLSQENVGHCRSGILERLILTEVIRMGNIT